MAMEERRELARRLFHAKKLASTTRVQGLRKLLKFVTQNGFEHHVAMVRGHHADVVSEAVTRYLGWPIYHHGRHLMLIPSGPWPSGLLW